MSSVQCYADDCLSEICFRGPAAAAQVAADQWMGQWQWQSSSSRYKWIFLVLSQSRKPGRGPDTEQLNGQSLPLLIHCSSNENGLPGSWVHQSEIKRPKSMWIVSFRAVNSWLYSFLNRAFWSTSFQSSKYFKIKWEIVAKLIFLMRLAIWC